MIPLREALEDYLRIRRRVGFKLKADQRLLEDFVGFLEQAGAERITTELALRWARLPVDAHPHRWRQRLGIVRVFARYVATLDPSSEVPSKDLLPARRPRVAPSIYSPAEISALMGAAGALTPPLRAAGFRTVIGLMATTGLRLGEALWLDRADVDLRDGAVHVRAGSTNSERCHCTPPSPAHCANTRADVTATRPRRRRRRSSSTRAERGRASPSSTTSPRSSSPRSAWREPASAPARAHMT
jgi:integrase